jgi:hypothetical protein
VALSILALDSCNARTAGGAAVGLARVYLRINLMFAHPAFLIFPSLLVFAYVRDAYQKRLNAKIGTISAHIETTSYAQARIVRNGATVAEGDVSLVRYAGEAQGGVMPLIAGICVQNAVITSGLDVPLPGLENAPLVHVEDYTLTPEEFASLVQHALLLDSSARILESERVDALGLDKHEQHASTFEGAKREPST